LRGGPVPAVMFVATGRLGSLRLAGRSWWWRAVRCTIAC